MVSEFKILNAYFTIYFKNSGKYPYFVKYHLKIAMLNLV